MTKADLADAIYRRHGGLSRRESIAIVEQILGRIKHALVDDRPVRISGFGRFEVVRRMARRGRNPRTGEGILLGERNSLVFRPSPAFLERVNDERPD